MTVTEDMILFYMGDVYNSRYVVSAFHDLESHDKSVEELKNESLLSISDLCGSINSLIIKGYIKIIVIPDLSVRLRFTHAGLMKYYAMYRANEGRGVIE